jgi:hypothetical protein
MTALRLYKGAVQPPVKGWAEEWSENVMENGDIKGADWALVDVTLEENDAVAPDGTTTATAVQCTNQAGAQTPRLQRNVFNIPVPGRYTWSAYVKKDSIQYAYLLPGLFSDIAGAGIFDLDGLTWTNTPTEAIDSGYELATVTYPNAPAGWYRIWLVVDHHADLSGRAEIGLSEHTILNRITDPTTADRIWVWGYQVNRGSAPTKHLLTTGTAEPWQRFRTEASSPWTPSDPVTNYHTTDATIWNHNATYLDHGAAPAAYVTSELGQLIPMWLWADTNIGGSQLLEFYNNPSLPSSAEYATLRYSVYTMPGDQDEITVKIQNWHNGSDPLSWAQNTINFNLTSGSYSGATDVTVTMTLVDPTANLYRLIVEWDITDDVVGQMIHRILDAGDPTPVLNGTQNLYLGGSLLEVNPTAATPPKVPDSGSTAGGFSRVFDSNVLYLYKGAVQPTKFPSDFRTRRRGGASVFDEMGELQQQIYARRQKKQLLQLAALAAGAINQRR